jgi:serine/threonine protein phosphatase PrpC
MLRFRHFARSHQGNVRQNNEDAGFAGLSLLLVADGVGGAAAGEIASATTVHVVTSVAMRPEVIDDPAATLGAAINAAYARLRDGVRASSSRAGMATTLTAVLTDGAGFALAHIGDSRGYLLRDQELRQVTRDDTLVQALVDDGDISAEDVATHPLRSHVVKSITPETPPEAHIAGLDVQEGDRLLLCSDGLSDVVDRDAIASILAEGTPESAASALVDAALAAGGPDNVTCVVADVESGELVATPGQRVGALRDPANLVDPDASFTPSG